VLALEVGMAMKKGEGLVARWRAGKPEWVANQELEAEVVREDEGHEVLIGRHTRTRTVMFGDGCQW